MKKIFSPLAFLVLILALTLITSAIAEEVHPGDAISVSIPFSSTDPILALQVNYTISDGLQFIAGSSSGGMMGSASENKAVFINLGGSSGGTVTLKLRVKADAAGDQTVAVTSVMGGSSGDTSKKSVGAAATYTFTVLANAVPTATAGSAQNAVQSAAPTPMSTAAPTSVPTAAMPADKTAAVPNAEKSAARGTASSDVPVLPSSLTGGPQEGAPIGAPEGFEVLEAAETSVPKYFIGIQIPGLSHPIYAFTDKEGRTQFRVYGRLGKQKGMYEVEVLAELMDESIVLKASVTGEKPIKDKLADRAEAKAVVLDGDALPAGYKTTSKTGVMYFVNLFKQKEYRVLGEMPNGGKAYYPVINNRPQFGSLPIDLEGDNERMIDAGEKYYRVPKEYREGFAVRVIITTSDGQSVSVWTDDPILDKNKLK